MAKPRKARLAVMTFTVECAYCGEETTEPNRGSYMWSQDEVTPGTWYHCVECDGLFEIPKVVKFNRV